MPPAMRRPRRPLSTEKRVQPPSGELPTGRGDGQEADEAVSVVDGVQSVDDLREDLVGERRNTRERRHVVLSNVRCTWTLRASSVINKEARRRRGDGGGSIHVCH